MTRQFTLAAFLVSTLLGSTGAMAQSVRQDRSFDAQYRRMSQPAAAKPQLDSYDAENGAVVAPGIQVLYGAAFETGYDRNLDLQSDGQKRDGFYGLADLGAALITGSPNRQTAFVGRGTIGHFEVDTRPDRWDAGILIDHHSKLAPTWFLTAGGFFHHDALGTEHVRSLAGYYQIAHRSDAQEFFLRGRMLGRNYLNDTIVGGRPLSVDRTFSYNRIEKSVGLMVAKNMPLAPFVEMGIASLDYDKQFNDAVLDRDAREVWGVAGVRLTLSKALRMDFGGRINHRRLEDRLISSHTGSFADIKLVYEPSDRFSFEANIDRTFHEASHVNGRLTDQRALRASATQRFDAGISVKLESGVVRHDQIGANVHSDERYIEGRVGKMISSRAELYATAAGQSVKDSETGDKPTHGRVGVGLKVGF